MKRETKTRNRKKAKKERQEGRKKDKSKRETEKEKQKRGRPKKVKGGRKRNTENKPKKTLSRGENRVFLLKTKKGKEPKRKQKATKNGSSRLFAPIQGNLKRRGSNLIVRNQDSSVSTSFRRPTHCIC